MYDACELKLLFATDYTDACYHAVRSVAQLADMFQLCITIANVGEPPLPFNRELESFFAEADHYRLCKRIRLQGSPAKALAEYASKGDYDLILAPRSDRLGIPRPFHRSTRVQMMRSARTPLWTGSRGLDKGNFLRPYQTIAVGIDGSDTNLVHLDLAASFANRVGAKLRLLTVVPPVHEGTLHMQTKSVEPLSEEVAIDRIEQLLEHWAQVPAIDIAIGSPGREIPRMVARCEADLLFLSESQSCNRFLFPQVSRTVDQSPCGVICVPDSLPRSFQWNFETTDQSEVIHRRESIVNALAQKDWAKQLFPRSGQLN